MEDKFEITAENYDQCIATGTKMCRDVRKYLIGSLPFFSICLSKYDFMLDDKCPEGSGGYVAFDQNNNLISGLIHISLQEIMSPEFKYNNLAFIALHELMHIMNGHIRRCKNRNPILWNLATDHVINTFIKYECCKSTNQERCGGNQELKIAPIPYQGWEGKHYFIIDELQNENHSAEEIYEYLLEQNNNNVIELDGNQNSSNDKDSKNNRFKSEYIGKDKDGNSWYKVTDKKTGRQTTVKVTNSKNKEKESKAEANGQSELRGVYNSAKNRGTISNSLISILDSILKVELPWDEIVKKAIKQNVIVKPVGRSYRSINPFYRPIGYILPGSDYENENDGVGTLIVMVDSSGSISDENLKQFLGIIIDSARYFKSIKVLVHDVEVQQELNFDNDTINDLLKIVKTDGFKGRGGTSHKPVFELIESYFKNEKELVDDLSMVIGLTDGYSDIEENWNLFRWTDKIPSFFVLTEDGKKLELDNYKNTGQVSMNQTGTGIE